jgi:hypothetical protein
LSLSAVAGLINGVKLPGLNTWLCVYQMEYVYYPLSTLKSPKCCGKINAPYQGMGKTMESIAQLVALILAFASRDSAVEAETSKAQWTPKDDASELSCRPTMSQPTVSITFVSKNLEVDNYLINNRTQPHLLRIALRSALKVREQRAYSLPGT